MIDPPGLSLITKSDKSLYINIAPDHLQPDDGDRPAVNDRTLYVRLQDTNDRLLTKIDPASS